MASLIFPYRCTPPDLINPFLDWRAAPLVCTLLLLAVAAALHLLRPASGGHRNWPAIVALVGGLGSLAVSAWVWLQSALFFPMCVPALQSGAPQFQIQTFDVRAIPVAVRITEAATTTILAVAIAVVCYRLIARARAARG